MGFSWRQGKIILILRADTYWHLFLSFKHINFKNDQKKVTYYRYVKLKVWEILLHISVCLCFLECSVQRIKCFSIKPSGSQEAELFTSLRLWVQVFWVLLLMDLCFCSCQTEPALKGPPREPPTIPHLGYPGRSTAPRFKKPQRPSHSVQFFSRLFFFQCWNETLNKLCWRWTAPLFTKNNKEARSVQWFCSRFVWLCLGVGGESLLSHSLWWMSLWNLSTGLSLRLSGKQRRRPKDESDGSAEEQMTRLNIENDQVKFSCWDVSACVC